MVMKIEEIQVGRFYLIDVPNFGTYKFKCVEDLLLVDGNLEPTGKLEYKFICKKSIFGQMEVNISKQESVDFWNVQPYSRKSEK